MQSSYKIKKMCQLALLIAIAVVLNSYVTFKTMGLKISITFIPVAICGMMFGPWWAAATYAIADLVGVILAPSGPFNPGFTVSAAAMGALYGLFLYSEEYGNRSGKWLPKWRKMRFFPNIIVPPVVSCMVLGMFVNSLWLAMMYSSKSYWGWVMYRLPQEVALTIVQIVLLPVIIKMMQRIKKHIS